MCGWMDNGWMDEWTDNEQMDEWTMNECTYGWMDGLGQTQNILAHCSFVQSNGDSGAALPGQPQELSSTVSCEHTEQR